MNAKICSFYIGRAGSPEFKEFSFNDRGLSLVRGDSATGKTATLRMLDHLFLASDAKVPDQDVMSKIDRCGLKLSIGDDQIYIVRWLNGDKSQMAYVDSRFPEDLFPADECLISVDDAKRHLEQFVGFDGAVRLLPLGSRRAVGRVNLRNWARISLKGTANIISDESFFYRLHSNVSNVWTMRESLPFFWGAYGHEWREVSSRLQSFEQLKDESASRKRERRFALEALERSVVKLKSSLSEDIGVKAPKFPSIRLSLNGSRRESAFSAFHTALRELSSAAEELRGSLVFDLSAVDESYRDIERELQSLRNDLNDLRQQRSIAASDHRLYQDLVEFPKLLLARKKRAREVFSAHPHRDSDVECPVCGSDFSDREDEGELEALSIGRVSESLRLQEQTAAKAVELTNANYKECLRKIEELDKSRRVLASRLVESNRSVGRIELVDRVIGDVLNVKDALEYYASLWGARQSADTALEELEHSEIAFTKEIISRYEYLDRKLSRLAAEFHDRIALAPASIVRGIELDKKSLTLRLDIGEDMVALETKGSSQNALWANLAYALAIAAFSQREGSWVPSFLVLDQPSAVWFSAQNDKGSYRGVEACQKLYQGIADIARDFDLQVIALDHDVQIPEGVESADIVEWFDGDGLVPRAWA